jgi:hypothetical protein
MLSLRKIGCRRRSSSNASRNDLGNHERAGVLCSRHGPSVLGDRILNEPTLVRQRAPGRALIVCCLIALLASACTDEDGTRISRDSFEGEWPFTVDEGVLSCEGAGAVTFSAEGSTYAVNGTAMGTTDYPDVDAIWADDPAGPGPKIWIGDVIDQGLELCE